MNNIVYLTNEIITKDPLTAADSSYYENLQKTWVKKYDEKRKKKKESSKKTQAKRTRIAEDFRISKRVLSESGKQEIGVEDEESQVNIED